VIQIVYFINVVYDDILIEKSSWIILILIGYIILVNKINPYKYNNYLQFDTLLNFVVILSIIFSYVNFDIY
jgi:hypothetical protein